jgi:cyclopropane-fatty-acyl-phospholipid synthase
MYSNIVTKLLDKAGVAINGSNPWDIQVYNPKFYSEVVLRGSLGFGESYVKGWWDVEQLEKSISKIISASLHENATLLGDFFSKVNAKYRNLQKKSRAFQVGEHHYDIGNDLYLKMLDKRMAYSCGYWQDTDDLDQAQENKLELVCRKVHLKPGMRILEIGCGWGSFAKYAAEKYQVEVVGVTVSKEQMKLAQENCAGLPVEIQLMDYRDLTGEFDAIVSIGMFEHVGHKNYAKYFKVAERCLKDNGLFLLHTIGKNDCNPGVNPWTAKYIFPNGELPSLEQITHAVDKTGMYVEDVENFGVYYETTLMAWFDNFNRAWDSLKDKYSEEFYRLWKFYLLSCAGAFNARDIHLWQVVMSKGNMPQVYKRNAL